MGFVDELYSQSVPLWGTWSQDAATSRDAPYVRSGIQQNVRPGANQGGQPSQSSLAREQLKLSRMRPVMLSYSLPLSKPEAAVGMNEHIPDSGVAHDSPPIEGAQPFLWKSLSASRLAAPAQVWRRLRWLGKATGTSPATNAVSLALAAFSRYAPTS